ncbi:DUF3221 domain-containing protein [Halobacillus seohaensis]|uniref:DUF3221 domain-containing protein n=1 Tax=Halobacillus seohaensis TaxID=447421 RepID=A0ABW2EF13_9BACI
MKKWMLVLLLFGVACGKTEVDEGSEDAGTHPEEESEEMNSFSGYVMDQHENRILVVNTIENEGGSPIWVSGVDQGMWIGKKVEVRIAGQVAESYPMQGEAKDVQVVESPSPEGASLTESQVLAKALAGIDRSNALAVESLTYEAEDDHWTVKLRSTVTESGSEKVIISDKLPD